MNGEGSQLYKSITTNKENTGFCRYIYLTGKAWSYKNVKIQDKSGDRFTDREHSFIRHVHSALCADVWVFLYLRRLSAFPVPVQ